MEKSIQDIKEIKTFCTIINEEFIPFAISLYKSISSFDSSITLKVLLINEKATGTDIEIDGIEIIQVSSILNSDLAISIYAKYSISNFNILRWALKPVLISYLLNSGYNKVIYTDADTFYVGDYQFLFQELNINNILLTPHWRSIDPIKDEDNFCSLLKDGLFNAGFIGASVKGLNAIDWWAGVCHYRMDRKIDFGVYDDQKYLDILPVAFENIKILKHKGCNIAFWNIDTCKREIKNKLLFIEGKFEAVFIHFTPDTIKNILNGNDKLLRPILKEYESMFISQGANLYELMRVNKSLFSESLIQSVKRKLLFRTRVKKFLYRLAEVI